MEGLNDIQVQERVEKGWINYVVESPEKTNKQIVKDNIFTYFNLIFFVLSILLIIAGSYRSLTFLPIIIANTLIGIIQEIRAKNNQLQSSKSQTLRRRADELVRKLTIDHRLFYFQ